MQCINVVCTIVAIAFALLSLLGLALPRSRARQIIDWMGAELLSLPLTVGWLRRKKREAARDK